MKIATIVGFLSMVLVCQGAELFQVLSEDGNYKFSYWQARDACKNIGASLATADELEEARKSGCGWTTNRSAWFPMAEALDGCGSRAELHRCNWGSGLWNAFCYRGDPIGNCSAPFGIETGEISNAQMMASSEHKSVWPIFRRSRWTAQHARLNMDTDVNAWMPVQNSRQEYLEVDFDTAVAVTGILTQGASHVGGKYFVSNFTVRYSKDGHNYKTLEEDGVTKIFPGNTDNNRIVRNMFPEPVLARHIRIHPNSWNENGIAMRIELLGCNMEVYKLAEAMSRDISIIPVGDGDTFTEQEPPGK